MVAHSDLADRRSRESRLASLPVRIAARAELENADQFKEGFEAGVAEFVSDAESRVFGEPSAYAGSIPNRRFVSMVSGAFK